MTCFPDEMILCNFIPKKKKKGEEEEKREKKEKQSRLWIVFAGHMACYLSFRLKYSLVTTASSCSQDKHFLRKVYIYIERERVRACVCVCARASVRAFVCACV